MVNLKDTKTSSEGSVKHRFALIVADDKIRKMVLFLILLLFLYVAYILSPLRAAPVATTADDTAVTTESGTTETGTAAPVTSNVDTTVDGTAAPETTAPATGE